MNNYNFKKKYRDFPGGAVVKNPPATSSENLRTTNAGEGVEKREPSCTVDGNVN